MPVTVKQVKTAIATDKSELVSESGKDYVVQVRASWSANDLEELGIAIATILGMTLNPIP